MNGKKYKKKKFNTKCLGHNTEQETPSTDQEIRSFLSAKYFFSCHHYRLHSGPNNLKAVTRKRNVKLKKKYIDAIDFF